MIIKVWGSWTLFQSLLTVLRSIGDRHGGVSIANVATRWVLEHPFVGAVLIGTLGVRLEAYITILTGVILKPRNLSRLGTRLGLSAHTDDNHRVFTFNLTSEDQKVIEDVLDQSNGRRLITSIGDCGAEYR